LSEHSLGLERIKAAYAHAAASGYRFFSSITASDPSS
jgi:hypothetical protein